MVDLTQAEGYDESQPLSASTVGQEMSYLVKVVDPLRKGQYKVHKLRKTVVFTTCTEIRSAISESLAEHVPADDEYDIGYIEPSKQGVRGKTRWIFNESDIEDMYEEYNSSDKKEIILWCDGCSKSGGKRRCSPPSSSRKKAKLSTGELNAKTLDEVDTVYQELADKHGEKFDAERLRMWAHLRVGILLMKLHLTFLSFEEVSPSQSEPLQGVI